MRILTNANQPLVASDGSVQRNVSVTFTLVNATTKKPIRDAVNLDTKCLITEPTAIVKTDNNGIFSVSLTENDKLDIATMYLCQIHDKTPSSGFFASISSGIGALSFFDFRLNGQPLNPAELSTLQAHIDNANVHLSQADRLALNAMSSLDLSGVFSWGDAMRTIGDVPIGATIFDIDVRVQIPFNVESTLSITDNNDNVLFTVPGLTDLVTYQSSITWVAFVPTQLFLSISLGDGASQGNGIFYITIKRQL